MAITLLPTPPSRQDPANFNVRADEFLGALPTFGTEANSLAADVNSKQITASNAATTATAAASTATTKAGEASTSASAANSARIAAEAALDSFDDRYLGQKSSNPTADNDGGALLVGALYFRTTAPSGMKVLTASGTWDDAYANLSSKYDKTGGNISGSVTVSGNLLVTGGALGYGIGAGGAVVQATSKSTAVTLNKPSGQITMHNESLAAGATARFILGSTYIAASDEISVWLSDPVGNVSSHIVWVDGVVDGFCGICVKNINTVSLPLPLKIGFAVRKVATS